MIIAGGALAAGVAKNEASDAWFEETKNARAAAA
jgi:hypothetical protein